MGMFNFVLDSFKGEIFDFKVKRQGLIAGTVSLLLGQIFNYECITLSDHRKMIKAEP